LRLSDHGVLLALALALLDGSQRHRGLHPAPSPPTAEGTDADAGGAGDERDQAGDDSYEGGHRKMAFVPAVRGNDALLLRLVPLAQVRGVVASLFALGGKLRANFFGLAGVGAFDGEGEHAAFIFHLDAVNGLALQLHDGLARCIDITLFAFAEDGLEVVAVGSVVKVVLAEFAEAYRHSFGGLLADGGVFGTTGEVRIERLAKIEEDRGLRGGVQDQGAGLERQQAQIVLFAFGGGVVASGIVFLLLGFAVFVIGKGGGDKRRDEQQHAQLVHFFLRF